MLPINENINILAGKFDLEKKINPLIPFSEIVCEFLNVLSSELLKDQEAKKYSDIVSFAFWCRRGNVLKLKEEFAEKKIRIGLGFVFHIAPSNVPINFAFSYIFSLLAGNANVVRVPSKRYEQIEIVIRIINMIFLEKRFNTISNMSLFIKYLHNDEITSRYSELCNVRIIWGGDSTINEIRKMQIPERSIDIAFADRYSFCMIDIEKIIEADEIAVQKLASGFYNDTYLMDQNACSSPHLIIWIGKKEREKLAKERFWKTVHKVAADKYEFKPVNAVDKYTQICRDSIRLTDEITGFSNYGNLVYCLQLGKLNENISELRGKFGYFYEYTTEDLECISEIVNNRYQTLTYYGVDKNKIAEIIIDKGLNGIDRIVPIGEALDISLVWDGFDLVRTLSRIIDVK